ncbi:MAG: LytR family transcriptional regulator [Lachnospiraceae bacterium]|nr:LytR family transcriptional regulator [Lachnospiraceae bacterium]
MSKSRKKKKSTNRRLGIVLLVEILVFIGLIVGYAWYYFNYAMNLMQTDDTPKEEIDVSNAVTETMESTYTTIALFGLDTREKNANLTSSGVAHSDAVILVSINNETKEVRMASVYRDCFLEIASKTPTTQKFTHAYLLGGPTCSVETLNRNLDLNIKDYVSVDFMALTKAIDALGGVTINVKSKEINNLNKNIEEQVRVTGNYSDGVWSAGEQTLNGTQATAYARIRKVGNGDFERTQRQRKVIEAMVEKAKNSDLSTLSNVIKEVFPDVATNMTQAQILDLAKDLLQYELGDNMGFPSSNKTPTLGSKGSVVVPADLLSNVKFLHEFLYPEDKDYVPSSEVERISKAITNETGVYDEFSEEDTTEEPTSTNSDE